MPVGRGFWTGCSVGVLILVVVGVVNYMAHKSSIQIHHHTFTIEVTPIQRLCQMHNIVTVNGQLPGPTLYVNNGDNVVVTISNNGPYNATIHWHGIHQLRTGWADGPEYITQCPIQPGGSYTYRFTIVDQEGTLWWHAHVAWLRATVHGAIVIYPKKGSSYPFPKPKHEATIVLGEWWNSNPIDVWMQADLIGAAPSISDAFTINGQPGDLYPCSSSDTFKLPVTFGETYLLRIVGAALNTELFFKIADHEFVVVAVDACYTKPYRTDVIMITPGQTVDILLTANRAPGQYYMAARAYSSSLAPFGNTITTAILMYDSSTPTLQSGPLLPSLPLYNDTAAVTEFTTSLRSLASFEHPVEVPQTIDENIITTVGLGLRPCPPDQTCGGSNGKRFIASMNNISFVFPTISILQASYFAIDGVFQPDFPGNPPIEFDYTGGEDIPADLWNPESDTRVRVIRFDSNVQLVFQGTNIISGENHPMHLHGFDFYVVGEGFGNYDPLLDPLNFNLVDPVKRNTVGVPANGWAAIRFKANNPGAWFLHCHLDVHLMWGLTTVFLVTNGPGLLALEAPPPDLPVC